MASQTGSPYKPIEVFKPWELEIGNWELGIGNWGCKLKANRKIKTLEPNGTYLRKNPLRG
jgi:hypothetical protein